MKSIDHIDIRTFFVRDLKDEGVIEVQWIPTSANESDVCTKNTKEAVYLEHIKHFVGHDEYFDK